MTLPRVIQIRALNRALPSNKFLMIGPARSVRQPNLSSNPWMKKLRPNAYLYYGHQTKAQD
jgi:hypothetical protein